MYLSKVRITGAACRNPYELHRRLWQLFDTDADAERDFLFRVEQANAVQATVLMQSARPPSVDEKDAELLAKKPYTLSLSEGQRLRFLLVANPVKTIRDEQGRVNVKGDVKSCRVPLIREEAQREWLVRKFASIASVEELLIDNLLPVHFRKHREKRAGKIQPVSFQGMLCVQQPESFIQLIKKGIGPGKAFGCGLVSIASA
tara:strand:- start:115 stop:720 length:606 start_codon:yes stop_codon:yes gene_type:complete